tara:strand:+ start:15146 stop:16345 length:1200 start_codon:yes stop_codon:yes gene_type:complete
MITFANIVDRFEKFVENHFFLKTFSFGSPEDLDLNKFENYPLLHLVYTSGNYVDKVKTYTLEVYIMDCPRGEENRKEFERDVITQSELCAEDILADLENGGAIFDFDFAYILESASITPLEEENSNTLSGTLLTISIGVPYLYDSCNAPLTGVSPQGTSTTYSARGLLRVKEVDGTPDVTTVKTITVSNGTLTDDGNGAVTIDTGGGGSETLAGLTDTNISSPAEGQALVYDNATSKWVNGFGGTSGAVSVFQLVGGDTQSFGAGTTIVDMGSILGGAPTVSAVMKAGWAAGVASAVNAQQVLASAVSAGSFIQVELKYNVTIAGGSVCLLGANTVTGIFQNTTPSFVLHSADATDVVATGTSTQVIMYQTSNALRFQIVATGSGTLQIEYWKITVTHA